MKKRESAPVVAEQENVYATLDETGSPGDGDGQQEKQKTSRRQASSQALTEREWGLIGPYSHHLLPDL